MKIQPYDPKHTESIVRLSLRAWAPVFESIEKAMDREVYCELYPDWRVIQRKAVEAVCASDDMAVWVAIEDSVVAGFVAVKLDIESKMGEIYMIAVDPDYQRRGICTALTEFALNYMKTKCMSIAMVNTGGDPGHAPARSSYEKSGFRPFPNMLYFKKL